MSSKIITRARVLAAFFCAAAVATIVVASPVVVTPGASAGYLYFPSAPAVSGGGGAAPENDPVAGTCGEKESIGDECIWSDGLSQILAAKNSGGYKKLFILKGNKEVAMPGHSCDIAGTSQSDGEANTIAMSKKVGCTPAVTCMSLGTDVFMPAINQVGSLYVNRTVLGLDFSNRLYSSTVTSRNYYTYMINGNVYTQDVSTYPSGKYICLRGIK